MGSPTVFRDEQKIVVFSIFVRFIDSKYKMLPAPSLETVYM